MTELLILITAVIFYLLGRWSTSKELEQRIDDVLESKPVVTIIKRPTKKELDKRKNNKHVETEKAMEEILDETL